MSTLVQNYATTQSTGTSDGTDQGLVGFIEVKCAQSHYVGLDDMFFVPAERAAVRLDDGET
jgi:hypothetical protein